MGFPEKRLWDGDSSARGLLGRGLRKIPYRGLMDQDSEEEIEGWLVLIEPSVNLTKSIDPRTIM